MLLALVVVNTVIVIASVAAVVRLAHDAGKQQAHRDELLVVAMQTIVSTVLNPYGETDAQPAATNTIHQADTESGDAIDFDYDLTDTLIGSQPPPLPHMIVPRGYDPTPGADNSPEAIAERLGE